MNKTLEWVLNRRTRKSTDLFLSWITLFEWFDHFSWYILLRLWIEQIIKVSLILKWNISNLNEIETYCSKNIWHSIRKLIDESKNDEELFNYLISNKSILEHCYHFYSRRYIWRNDPQITVIFPKYLNDIICIYSFIYNRLPCEIKLSLPIEDKIKKHQEKWLKLFLNSLI